MQFLNSHILLDNRCVLQQQHVDCKIADELLKKGTKQHADGWDTGSKDWDHMVLHLPYDEGGFGVPFNCVTKDDAFILLRHALYLGWVLSLRNVRSCGYLRMICGTRPLGHRPHLCSFVTSILSCLLSTTVRRSVCRLNHRVMSELVLDEVPRMVSLNRRRMLLSPFRIAAVPSQFKVTQQVLLK
jgi:hypothetical protein